MKIGHDNIWNVFPVSQEEGNDAPNVDFLFNLSDFEKAEEIKAAAKKVCEQYCIPEDIADQALESGGNLYTNIVFLENGKAEFNDGGFPSTEGTGDLYLFYDTDMVNTGYSFSKEEKAALIQTACKALDISEKSYLAELNSKQPDDYEKG